MKKAYLILTILLLACGCSKEEKKESIPSASLSDFVDPLFFGYMQTQYDTNDDFIFQSEEIAAVTDLDLSKQTYIFNLKGLEKFVALENLNISGLNLQDRNLKITNPKLMQFVCSNMNIIELDIQNLTELEVLDCSKNPYMGSLDLSHNKKLRELNCESTAGFGSRTQLDLSNNVNIEKVNCYSHNMDEINLTNCNKLRYLDCNMNRLKSIDFSDCVELEYLNVGINRLTVLNIETCSLLRYLDIGLNNLETLDISNNIYLEELIFCPVPIEGTERINALDITNNVNLKKITIEMYSGIEGSIVFYIKQSQTKPSVTLTLDSSQGVISYEFQYK